MSDARWQRVQTDAGYHLRLMGDNEEPVLIGEPLDDPRNVAKALTAAVRACKPLSSFAAQADGALEEVDER